MLITFLPIKAATPLCGFSIGSVLVFYQFTGVVGQCQSTHSKQQNYHQFAAFMPSEHEKVA